MLYGKLEVRAYDWAESGVDVVYGTTRTATLVLNETLRVRPLQTLLGLLATACHEDVQLQGRACAEIGVCLGFPFSVVVIK